MKKGFTLIELLAVIVILAIIALIATPIVMNIISDVKLSANERSVENYIKAVEISVANKLMKGEILEDAIYSVDELDIKISGKLPTIGYVKIVSGKVEDYSIKIDDKEEEKDKEYQTWDGTVSPILEEDNNYYIENASELAWIAEQVNSGENLFQNKTIYLEANLDLNNIEWTPIGSRENDKSYTFNGNFDGNNHIIKNMYVNRTDLQYGGLFGKTFKDSNTYLKNLIIKDSQVLSSNLSGIFLGSASKAIVQNIFVYNSKIESNGISVGAVLGSATKESTIENIVSYNNIIRFNTYGGGIVGDINCNSSKLKSLNNNIVGNESSGGIAGYFVGNNVSTHYDIVSKNNEIVGEKWVGGITGFIDGATTTKLISDNNTIYGTTLVGGIAGYIQNSSVLDDAFANSRIYTRSSIGITKIGGVSGGIQNSTIKNSTSLGVIDMDNATIVGGIVGLTNTYNLNTPSIIENVNSTISINAASDIGTIIGRVSYNTRMDNSNITLNINGVSSSRNIGTIDNESYVMYE